jgi:hypothetical protein
MKPAYLAAFRGQGGILTSYGIDRMAARARRMGYEADVYGYRGYTAAYNAIKLRQARGYLIAGLAYSLGVTTLTWLTEYLKFDLVLGIAGSNLGQNHRIESGTGRSVLWRNPKSLLSGAGTGLGFTEIIEVTGVPHLFMDFAPTIVDGVDRELQRLIA